MNIIESVKSAYERIQEHVVRTPLVHSKAYSDVSGCEVFFKLESLQHTGSFKLRGAFNKLLSLQPQILAKGVVAASSGNHGAAVSFALAQLGHKGVVFVPKNTSPVKTAAIKRFAAEVREYGDDGVDTERFARDYATKKRLTYISPYNDAQVIAGQGTIGLELQEQLPEMDALYLSVGGGGLIGGIAGYLKSAGETVTITGCLPENSPVMAKSIEAGHIIEMRSEPTLSDGTAGGIEADTPTFELCRNHVDHFQLVSEAEIRQALVEYIDYERMLLEGAAAVAIAGFQKNIKKCAGKNVVIIICGANISRETLKKVI